MERRACHYGIPRLDHRLGLTTGTMHVQSPSLCWWSIFNVLLVQSVYPRFRRLPKAFTVNAVLFLTGEKGTQLVCGHG